MTPRGFLTSLVYTAMIMKLHCQEVLRLPPPTELSHEWLDKFTLRLFWKKPEGLPDSNEIKFMVMENNQSELPTCVGVTNHTTFLLTEETDSDWMYSIWTLDCNDCSKFQEASKGNPPAIITIKPPKPRAKVVTDFRCLTYPNILSCSWIPVNPSLNVTLSYRRKGESEESIKSLKQCDQPYSQGKRNHCDLHIDSSIVPSDICILVETEAGMSTFNPVLVVHPPKLNITEEGDSLNVNLTPPNVGAPHCWQYEVCYKQCMVMETCQNTTRGDPTMKVPYDKRCLYEFKSKVRIDESCGHISSNFSEYVSYGKNEPPDRTLTVIAIVIPIILSICVILSCYCLRRHSTIICPTIPDPSTIFKEMMMNGPKDLKTGQNLYMPVPERLESPVILVPESSILQQNS